MDKGNIELAQLIKHFESFNHSEHKSPPTVEWYGYVLDFFHKWLKDGERATNLGGLDEDVARDFILHLQDRIVNGRHLSSHTVANRVRGLRAFFSWLAREGYTESNALADLRVPKTDDKLIEILTEAEVDRLFRAINADSETGARNTAMLTLFLDAGLRLTELATLKEQDVHLNERYVKVMGKGSKERMLPLGAKCHRAMLHYYYHLRPEPAHAGADTFFLSMDRLSLNQRRSKVPHRPAGEERADPPFASAPFRHTYATQFLLNGGDVFLLKQNLGHTTLAMVEHYRHFASQLAAVTSRSFSPLDHMDAPSLRRRNGNRLELAYVYPNTGKARQGASHAANRKGVAGSPRGNAQIASPTSPRRRSGA